MEYVHPHLLTTEEIIRILHEREIFLPDVNSLSASEVVHIYNKFVVPHSQRNSTKNAQIGCSKSDSKLPEKAALKRILPPAEEDCISKFSRITLTINFNSPLEKRSLQNDAVYRSPKKQRIA